MALQKIWDVAIIGGGLAGLCCARHLSLQGIEVVLIEKNTYPHHKVCGEYISNEVLPYFEDLGIHVFQAGAKNITTLEMTGLKGNEINVALPLGGFGISRFTLDNLLYKSIENSVEVIFDTVEGISNESYGFDIEVQKFENPKARLVVGAFGKRSNLDVFFKRDFIQKKSPWLAVKAHYNYHFNTEKVALHAFNGGYCGISAVEDNTINVCYLTTYASFKKVGNIEKFQKEVMSKNKNLNNFFSEATPLFDKPLSISQISFQQKETAVHGICMLGDSAGLIHPLCGNGMAMAIHSAKIFSELYINEKNNEIFDTKNLIQKYTQQWHETFSQRLRVGGRIQRILLNPHATKFAFKVANFFPSIVPLLIKKTHGTIWK